MVEFGVLVRYLHNAVGLILKLQTCQLGRHCPISKVLRDGILRVGRTAASNLASEPVDDWFTSLPDIPAASTLRLYAQVRRFDKMFDFKILWNDACIVQLMSMTISVFCLSLLSDYINKQIIEDL